MAKKIKFPLEMENGVQVRSIEELKANFSLARVLFYIYNGKLITWLKDRNAQSIADKIETLNIKAPNFFKKVYSIFDINYSDTDIKQAQEINRKLNIFKNSNIEDKYIDVIDSIAFDQSDLYNLVNNNKTKIYLYGDKFLIPLNRINITYIGINNPTIICNEEEKRKYTEKGITFIDVTYDKTDMYKEELDLEKFDISTVKDLKAFIIKRLNLYGVTTEILNTPAKLNKKDITPMTLIDKISSIFNNRNKDKSIDIDVVNYHFKYILSKKLFDIAMNSSKNDVKRSYNDNLVKLLGFITDFELYL